MQGSADTPDFEVTLSRHKVGVTGDFRALVDGTNGTVDLQQIYAAFQRTGVESSGTVKGDNGRTADLKLGSRDGRIQDVLMLFIQSPVSPIKEPSRWSAHSGDDHRYLPKANLQDRPDVNVPIAALLAWRRKQASSDKHCPKEGPIRFLGKPKGSRNTCR